MFLEAHVERSSYLANILHVAIRTSKLANGTFFVLVLCLWVVCFHGQVFTNGIICGVSDFN
jgi:hypothetical protein